ncbi:MAG: hypothetical protein Q4C20_14995 [Erysipelotrichaceae bacterium]|jgi:predicted peptidase|nr:hypothetical protein [Erysipelotrichaceae bacterium]
MKKFAKVLTSIAAASLLAACSSAPAEPSADQQTETEPTAVTGTYTRFVQGDDWGASVSRINITFDTAVDSFDKDHVSITETRVAPDWGAEGMPLSMVTSQRNIIDAYLTDASGNKTTEASTTAVVELNIGPSEGNALTYNAAITRNEWSPYKLDIDVDTTAGGNTAAVTIAPNPAGTETSADMFSIDSYTASNGTTYGYAYYEPETESKTLVVWLHGGGEGHVREGGTDPRIPLLGNEAANLASEEFQNIVGGAYVLSPQCPSYWMDRDGHDSIAVQDYTLSTEKSFYTESLHEMIMAYKEKVGAEKVILTGCSNGGYMTLLQAINYTDDYDAYVMICESLKSENITDADIEKIKDKPLFFIWSSADTTVVPEDCSKTNVERLQAAGASDLHVFNPEKVTDTSGRFKDENGNAHEYAGHWSWIYFDNNEAVDENGLSAWDFIAQNAK